MERHDFAPQNEKPAACRRCGLPETDTVHAPLQTPTLTAREAQDVILELIGQYRSDTREYAALVIASRHMGGANLRHAEFMELFRANNQGKSHA